MGNKDGRFKKGQKPWNKGKKTGLIPWNKGIPMTEESKEKLSISRLGIGKGEKRPKQWGKKISTSLKEMHNKNPNLRKEMSERTKKQMSDPKARKAVSRFHKNKFIPLEQRKKHSEYMKKYWKENPELRKIADERMKLALKNKVGYREFRQKVRRNQIIPRKDSKPEILLQSELTKNMIRFEKHVSLDGQPDIFIEPNICIFVDGDYWHGYQFLQGRDFSKQKKFNNERFQKIIKYDLQIVKNLEKQEYNVLRFWEHEIKENPEKCLQKIIKIIKESGRQRG